MDVAGPERPHVGLAHQAQRGVGFDDLAEGTVYPALARLETAGHLDSYLLRSATGPARKYYRITPDGRTELARARRDWDALVDRVRLLSPTHLSTPTGA